jgi:hypothetical protein
MPRAATETRHEENSMRLLDHDDLIEKGIKKSKSQLYRDGRAGLFVLPIRHGSRNMWVESEVGTEKHVARAATRSRLPASSQPSSRTTVIRRDAGCAYSMRRAASVRNVIDVYQRAPGRWEVRIEDGQSQSR